MIEYEKEVCIYFVSQIHELLSRLCRGESNVPPYNIYCNLESSVERTMYEFKNFEYIGCKSGQIAKINNRYLTENGHYEAREHILGDLGHFEFSQQYCFNGFRVTFIIDTVHIPYETNFFNYVISAYFDAKNSVLKNLLKISDEDKKYMFLDPRDRSNFRGLNCDYEAETIIFQGIIDYFYNCYGMDVNLITTLSCEVYEGNGNVCGVYIPRRYVGRGKKHNGLTIRLNEKVDFNLNEIRRIRKYMEIASKELNIVLDFNRKIIGYTEEAPKKYEGKLVIDGKLNWKFYIGRLELVYGAGVYRIFNKSKAIKSSIDLHDLPSFLTDKKKEKILNILHKAQEQVHGTAIVFGTSEQIREETNRLASFNRCISILPINIVKKSNIILNITSIDGAILVCCPIEN